MGRNHQRNGYFWQKRGKKVRFVDEKAQFVYKMNKMLT